MSILMCQKNSYLAQFDTVLSRVVEGNFDVKHSGGKTEKVLGVGFVFQDTILFPEGGGQPCDHGTITFKNGEQKIVFNVDEVFRKEDEVVHLVKDRGAVTEDVFSLKNLPLETPVHEEVDWPRRRYHMKQHSGQHLISALAENLFETETLSWNLGSTESSFVELDTEAVSESMYNTLEREANSAIRNGNPVITHVYSKDDPELLKAKTRGLPEGFTGDVRVIEIRDIDRNMCCGTHVSNLSELQIIKFLKTENKSSKKKKSTLLHFVVGEDEVFRRFENLLNFEENISGALDHIPPAGCVDAILKLKDSKRKALKTMSKLQEENIMYIVNAFKSTSPMPPLFSLHRPDGDMQLLNFITRQFKDMDVTLMLSCGEGEEGTLLLQGDKQLISETSASLSDVLQAKGKPNGNRFQAKVNRLSAISQAQQLVKNCLSK